MARRLRRLDASGRLGLPDHCRERRRRQIRNRLHDDAWPQRSLLLVVLRVKEQPAEHHDDHDQDDQRIDGGVRTGAMLARRFALTRFVATFRFLAISCSSLDGVTNSRHCTSTSPRTVSIQTRSRAELTRCAKDANHCDKVS
jgi:hypothetical protein